MVSSGRVLGWLWLDRTSERGRVARTREDRNARSEERTTQQWSTRLQYRRHGDHDAVQQVHSVAVCECSLAVGILVAHAVSTARGIGRLFVELVGQRLDDLDAVDLRAELGEHRRLVAGARPHLQDAVADVELYG